MQMYELTMHYTGWKNMTSETKTSCVTNSNTKTYISQLQNVDTGDKLAFLNHQYLRQYQYYLGRVSEYLMEGQVCTNPLIIIRTEKYRYSMVVKN